MTLDPASAVSTALEEVVEAYRLGMEGQASEPLVKLIDLLTPSSRQRSARNGSENHAAVGKCHKRDRTQRLSLRSRHVRI